MVPMKLEDAVKRAGANEGVQRLKTSFLGSIFASLADSDDVKEWTLLYYNPRNRSVVDCFVSEKFVTVGEETPAINEIQELDTKSIKVDVKNALKTAREKMPKKTVNILISLHVKDVDGKPRTVWTIGMVTPDISVTTFDIDADSGAVLKEETTSLIRKV